MLTDTAIDMERSDRVIENTKFLDYVNYFKRFIQDDQTDTEEKRRKRHMNRKKSYNSTVVRGISIVAFLMIWQRFFACITKQQK